MEPIIIGLGFKKGVGKDTAAARLVDKHGFIRISFADSLKEACRIIFHFDNEQLYGNKKEVVDPRWGKTPREILQRMGTEGIRANVDDAVWIKSLQIKIQDLVKVNPNKQLKIAVPDVRFNNEVEALLSMPGGYVWKVDRPLEADSFSTHVSETELESFNNWSATLLNHGNMAHLYKLVDQELTNITDNKEDKNVFNRRRSETN